MFAVRIIFLNQSLHFFFAVSQLKDSSDIPSPKQSLYIPGAPASDQECSISLMLLMEMEVRHVLVKMLLKKRPLPKKGNGEKSAQRPWLYRGTPKITPLYCHVLEAETPSSPQANLIYKKLTWRHEDNVIMLQIIAVVLCIHNNTYLLHCQVLYSLNILYTGDNYEHAYQQ